MALNLSQPIYHNLSQRTAEGDFEIPIHIRSHEAPKWVSGIDRTTTCQQVLESLLTSKMGPGVDTEPFNLVEHWRGVERLLSKSSKILKLWLAWGDEQSHVKFVVKRVRTKETATDRDHGSARKSAAGGARTRNKVRRRNSNSSVGSKVSDTLHPKSLNSVPRRSPSKSSPDIQEMMRVIVNQGQAICKELQRMGHQSMSENNESVSPTCLNRSQSEVNLRGQAAPATSGAANGIPARLHTENDFKRPEEIASENEFATAELQSTSDLISELIRLHSLNEELQTVETKLHILSANLNQFMAPNPSKAKTPLKGDHHINGTGESSLAGSGSISIGQRRPGNSTEQCTLQQELDSLKRYNESAMADISRNKELISGMEQDFKTKKDSIKQLEYDFNLIEKEGKKLGREYEKVLNIDIPSTGEASRGSEGSALDDSAQVIYSELKELKLECQKIASASVEASPESREGGNKLLTSPVLTPASVSESGIDLSHEGSTSGASSGSESNGSGSSPLNTSHSLDEPKLVVHDFCSQETRSKLKSARRDRTDLDEDSNSDTGLSSLHSSSDEGAYEFGTLV